MGKFNINKEAVGTFVKKGCKVILYGLAVALPYMSSSKNNEATYSDAVSVVMNSAMFSGDKQKVLSMLKKYGDTDYYNSVIEVMESSMFSSDKIKTIEIINGK